MDWVDAHHLFVIKIVRFYSIPSKKILKMCPDNSLKIFFWNEPNWANFINKQIKLFSIDETLSWIDYSLCYETERKERIYMSFAWGQFEIRDWFLNQLTGWKVQLLGLFLKVPDFLNAFAF